jgi:RluA family pseudouridine synthase
MNLLHAGIERHAAWSRTRGLTYLMNAHRLDFETSGVLLLAKTKSMLISLANLFGSEKPVKTYVALAHGSIDRAEFEVGVALSAHPARAGEVRVDTREGRKARTLFTVRERFAGCTLLECRPLTSRTHQIRVHLRHIGAPIVGDALYGGHPLLLSRLKSGYRLKPGHVERPLLDRVALHAERLSLTHPTTGAPVEIASPMPKDLTVAVKYLRRYAAA